MSHLKLFLLGPIRIEQAETPIKLSRRKGIALLSYLAVTGDAHSREALVTLFWPNVDGSTGRAYLRRELAALNQALGSGLFLADNEQIGVDPKAALQLDVIRFVQLCADGQAGGDGASLPHLRHAEALYRGDFMAGFTLPDTPPFDEWQFFQREELHLAYATLLEQVVTIQRDQGDATAAIAHARRRLALDRLHMSQRIANECRFMRGRDRLISNLPISQLQSPAAANAVDRSRGGRPTVAQNVFLDFAGGSLGQSVHNRDPLRRVEVGQSLGAYFARTNKNELAFSRLMCYKEPSWSIHNAEVGLRELHFYRTYAKSIGLQVTVTFESDCHLSRCA